ncbi:DUF4385 family protein [Aquisphaera insulae]|uniref:DUF4385 family protein n=1 Tax=Aquisphaera insulae TaxID=2712864 RepID=UPI0013EDC798
MTNPGDPSIDDATPQWRPDVDDRANPELYRVGKGEQGVLTCQPYKGELRVLWRFKTPQIAAKSSEERGRSAPLCRQGRHGIHPRGPARPPHAVRRAGPR